MEIELILSLSENYNALHRHLEAVLDIHGIRSSNTVGVLFMHELA